MQLHHAGQDRHAGEMAPEIKQVRWQAQRQIDAVIIAILYNDFRRYRFHIGKKGAQQMKRAFALTVGW